jgi:hypothetical protein
MDAALGETYARTWADLTVLAELNSQTPSAALAAGVPPKKVWAAVWRKLELPENAQ